MVLATWLGVAEPEQYAAAKSAMLGSPSGPLFEPAPTSIDIILVFAGSCQFQAQVAAAKTAAEAELGSVNCRDRARAMTGG